MYPQDILIIFITWPRRYSFGAIWEGATAAGTQKSTYMRYTTS